MTISRKLMLQAALAALAERGIEATKNRNLQESVDLMKQSMPIIRELAEIEGDPEWTNIGDRGEEIAIRCENFLKQ